MKVIPKIGNTPNFVGGVGGGSHSEVKSLTVVLSAGSQGMLLLVMEPVLQDVQLMVELLAPVLGSLTVVTFSCEQSAQVNKVELEGQLVGVPAASCTWQKASKNSTQVIITIIFLMFTAEFRTLILLRLCVFF